MNSIFLWAHFIIKIGNSFSASLFRTEWIWHFFFVRLIVLLHNLDWTILVIKVLKDWVLVEILFHLPVSVDIGALTSKTKITEFGPTIIIDQDICWFDVPMHDVRWVQVVQRTQNVVHYDFDVLLAEVKRLVVTQKLSQVRLLMVHHDEDVF